MRNWRDYGYLMLVIGVLTVAAIGCGADDSNKRVAEHGDSADIYQAALNGDADALEAFIKDGADVNAPDADGMTPLHYAALSDNPDAVNALLKAGAELNARNAQGQTPMGLAESEGKSRTEEILDDRGGQE